MPSDEPGQRGESRSRLRRAGESLRSTTEFPSLQILPGLLNNLAQDAVDALTSIPVFTSIAASKYVVFSFRAEHRWRRADKTEERADRLLIYSAAEDCLTINVQRPAGISATAKLPVMVSSPLCFPEIIPS